MLCDEIDKRLFSKVDPFVREVLASIETCKHHAETKNTDLNEQQRVQQILEEQRSQIQTLKELRKILDEECSMLLSSMDSLQVLDQDGFRLLQKKRHTILTMATYIFIPLRHILCHHSPDKFMDVTASKNAQNIRRSTWYRYLEEAACTMSLVFTLLHHCNHAFYDENTTLIETEIRISCVIACATALSFVHEIANTNYNENGNRCDTSRAATMSENIHNTSVLDKGDECIIALMQCIENICYKPRLLSTRNPTTNQIDSLVMGSEKEFVIQMMLSMDGGLVAKIVQICNLYIEQAGQNFSRHSERLYHDNTHYSRTDVRGNMDLKLQVLDTLRALLNMTSTLKDDICFDCKAKAIGYHDDTVIMWQRFFPGCFSTLFRLAYNHMRFCTIVSSPKIVRKSLDALSLLLRHVTIVFEGMRNDEVNCNSSTKTSKNDNYHSGHFKFTAKLELHASSPLSTLVQLIPMIKSTEVRKAGVDDFCRSILALASSSEWKMAVTNRQLDNSEYNNEVKNLALECSLTMLGGDSNASVVETCRNLVTEYICEYKDTGMERVLSLLATLEVSCRSGREMQFRNDMNLISGILMILQNHGSKMFLASRLMEDKVKLSLAGIFTLDNRTHSVKGKAIVDTKMGTDLTTVSKISNVNEYLYMCEDTAKIANKMVTNMSQLLSASQSALYIDSCFAMFYDAMIRRINECNSFSSETSYSEWLCKHLGLVVLANQLLKGKANALQKRRKVSIPLATSLVPIILSDTLWLHPTVSELVNDTDFGKQSKINSAEIFIGRPLQHDSSFGPKENMDISHNVLDTYSVLITNLIETLGILSSILQHAIERFVPVLLFKLVQKTSNINSYRVQQSSSIALSQIARSIGKGSISEMLVTNYDYLMEKLSYELVRTSADGIQFQVIILHSLHYIINHVNDHNVRALSSHTITIKLLDVVDTTIAWFNKNFGKGKCQLLEYRLMINANLRFFIVSSKYLSTLFPCHSSTLDADRTAAKLSKENQPWFAVLDEFKINDNCEEISKQDLDQSLVLNSVSDISDEALLRIAKTTRKVLSSCLFFLSIPDLKIQVLCCEMLLHGFSLLSSTEKYSNMTSSSASKLEGSPFSEALADSWNIVILRLRETIDYLCFADKGSVSVEELRYTWKHSRRLLANLLNLICCLSELNPLSMASRYRQDLWPILSLLFNHVHQHENDNTNDVLLSVLDSIQRVFSSDSFGIYLSDTIPKIGTAVMPLLEKRDIIGEKAATLLDLLLQFDSDCLLRGLLVTSGIGLPTRPLLQQKPFTVSKKVTTPINNSIGTIRASRLLAKIRKAPEQVIHL